MNYVDLSHPLEPGPPTYPGDPPVEIEPHATHADDGYEVARLAMGSHSATHIDAPRHLRADGATLDDYPVETFAFEAVRVSVPAPDPRQPIVRADLPDLPDIDTDLPDGDSDLAGVDLVAVHTGWDARWGSPAYLNHPYLAPDLAGWLADRECHVGIDAISVDPTSTDPGEPSDEGTPTDGRTPTDRATSNEPEGFPAHRALLGADRLLVENLAGLANVPERFTLLAFPLAVPDADGAPVRAVACID